MSEDIRIKLRPGESLPTRLVRQKDGFYKGATAAQIKSLDAKWRRETEAQIASYFEATYGKRKGSIALKVTVDCLSPRILDGAVAVVEPKLPQPGDMAVVWLKNQGPTIKILRRKVEFWPTHPGSEIVGNIELEQLNPPRQFVVWCDHVECIARVRDVHSVAP